MIRFTLPTNVKIDLGLFPDSPECPAAKRMFEGEMMQMVRHSLFQWEYENPPETERAPDNR
jgi:hypothetical protein